MTKYYIVLAFLCLASLPASAQSYIFHEPHTQGQEAGKYSMSRTKTYKVNALRVGKFKKKPQEDSTVVEEETYPKIQVGGLLHLTAVGLQDKPTALQSSTAGYQRRWQRQMSVYRGRILVGGNISEKTSFFIETEIPTPIGGISDDTLGNKSMQVSPVLLDAQVEHIFADEFSIIAGLQLVGITRNGLQSAASLMALDFGYYQYPYNLFQNQPLQGNFGRDIGLNTRGFLANERFEYRVGVFAGRTFDRYSPLRVVTRFNFNFLDTSRDLYYTGTTLGEGNIFSVGGGFEAQGTYRNYALDAFLDKPLGEAGSITLNTAFNYMTGGDSEHPYSLTKFIPKQTVHFLELGFYINSLKIQPYFKYENQIVKGTRRQASLPDTAPQEALDDFNTLSNQRRIGGGIGYYFAGYNSTVKLSYENVSYGRASLTGRAEKQSRGELWLQLQFFVF